MDTFFFSQLRILLFKPLSSQGEKRFARSHMMRFGPSVSASSCRTFCSPKLSGSDGAGQASKGP